ncbi:hypothetical protein EIN_411490 [Entamoeba invadens IP1]|uniref:Ras-GAP domain-containing protein n=1 Tax=Entamoeba invadens IP1 TaxID=370355 RepID=A0A0A1U4J8_ENTIV|nr:hypothetical protein EIN_411490 [Entamoeba invadens IP1]ELP87796.1 hypothetical protein EIN_411490 [Entamoeba invadens IP1]|eukprot:XP_004254567.1 hypothetical protein EIN_411490 [Entamoeba invadens IP1]
MISSHWHISFLAQTLLYSKFKTRLNSMAETRTCVDILNNCVDESIDARFYMSSSQQTSEISSPSTDNSFFVSPANSKQITPEEIVRNLMLSKLTLLNGFSQLIALEPSKDSYIPVLLSYYSSRDKLYNVIAALAMEEINNTCCSNQLFRGNTVFTKFYGVYANTYCAAMLKETSETIVGFIKVAHYMKYLELPVIDESRKNIEREIFSTYTAMLRQNEALFPQHYKLILKRIYVQTREVRGEAEAIEVLTTLIFLRFLFVPFLATPSLLKCFQRAAGVAVKEMKELAISGTQMKTEPKVVSPVLSVDPKRKHHRVVGGEMRDLSKLAITTQENSDVAKEFIDYIKEVVLMVKNGTVIFTQQEANTISDVVSTFRLIEIVKKEEKNLRKAMGNEFKAIKEMLALVKKSEKEKIKGEMDEKETKEFYDWLSLNQNSSVIKQLQTCPNCDIKSKRKKRDWFVKRQKVEKPED